MKHFKEIIPLLNKVLQLGYLPDSKYSSNQNYIGTNPIYIGDNSDLKYIFFIGFNVSQKDTFLTHTLSLSQLVSDKNFLNALNLLVEKIDKADWERIFQELGGYPFENLKLDLDKYKLDLKINVFSGFYITKFIKNLFCCISEEDAFNALYLLYEYIERNS